MKPSKLLSWLQLYTDTPEGGVPYVGPERRSFARRARRKTWTEQLLFVLMQSDTVAVRFWLGLLSLTFGASVALSDIRVEYYYVTLNFPIWAITTAFIINGGSLVYGSLTERYSVALLFLEGILGVITWGSLGFYNLLTTGCPKYAFIASVVAFWLLIRYPTWKHK